MYKTHHSTKESNETEEKEGGGGSGGRRRPRDVANRSIESIVWERVRKRQGDISISGEDAR